MEREPKNIRDTTLAIVEQDIVDIKRQLKGDPDGHYEGLWDRVVSLESNFSDLKDSWETEKVERRIEKTWRTAFGAGLSALGILSAILLYLVNRVLQVMAGSV